MRTAWAIHDREVWRQEHGVSITLCLQREMNAEAKSTFSFFFLLSRGPVHGVMLPPPRVAFPLQ